MLPTPALSFTIPSIHDGITLDCRIYLPAQLISVGTPSASAWRKKAAIVAHPYGPMGGSQDDPIVHLVAEAILEQDFVVGTFNFRGSGGSKGRTSWTAKAEVNDYVSFVGFMVHFMYVLEISLSSDYSLNRETREDSYYDLASIPSHTLPPPESPSESGHRHSRFSQAITGMEPSSRDREPLLLLAGYSYGALITTLLPPLPTIIESFASPESGTVASAIRLLAAQLAKRENENISAMILKYKIMAKSDIPWSPTSPTTPRGRTAYFDQNADLRGTRTSLSSVRYGGSDSDTLNRRKSHDEHRRTSFEVSDPILRGVEKIRSLGHARGLHQRNMSQISTETKRLKNMTSTASFDGVRPNNVPQPAPRLQNVPLPDIKSAYLMISPLQGFVNSLATMWTAIPKYKSREAESPAEEKKLWQNPSLAIAGNADVFTSSKKFQSWAERLRSKSNGSFRAEEVDGAGHFWHEDGTANHMRDAVGHFVANL